MPYTEYITNEGDRLDTIANKAYGNPYDWQRILSANPSLPIQDVYAAGVRLVIEIQEQADVEQSVNLLPPWKR